MSSSSLIFVDDSLPGNSRRRSGKRWAYFGPDGTRITDRAEIDRMNAIALPPAYRDAWYSPAPNGHILATGYDERGRKQYRYHPDFRAERDAIKYAGCAGFGRRLPLLRARLESDLAGRQLTAGKTVAAVVRLLDLGALRVGNEGYARANKSFGATTLRRRHARLTGHTLKLSFRAKSGKERALTITDRSLAAAVRRMGDLPGQHLFQYLGADGAAHPVGSAEVNAYIRDAMGADFTAKHFRTFHASAMAFGLLADARGPVRLSAMLEAVAAHLGNTPTIARNSYIHPALLTLAKEDMAAQAEWRESLILPRRTRWLSRHERGLIALIEEAESAEAPAAIAA